MILSVVVPALNEAPVIEDTLSRLVVQDAVDEVIVVDNGSDDGTPHIVEQFAAAHPKVQPIRRCSSSTNRSVAYRRRATPDSTRREAISSPVPTPTRSSPTTGRPPFATTSPHTRIPRP
ncbi:glycosyltransferase family 2 protein [Nocardia africana]|uniref:Glycosyltransferase family 2 protein n=1 Tax=Nocardia africana TaxID=134964 RepID=A0ABW6NQF5_9NOCA